MNQITDQTYFREKLEQSKGYNELLELVKISVNKLLKAHRMGLMLYLEDLPFRVGAYHQVGSNGIVLNRRLVDAMANSTKSITEFNSFIFSLLLHEYLHSLGYLDEHEVSILVHRISLEIFGADHPAVQMSKQIPVNRVLLDEHLSRPKKGLELIKNFEKPRHQYVV